MFNVVNPSVEKTGGKDYEGKKKNGILFGL